MNRKQCSLMVAIAFFASLLGGVFSSQLFEGKQVFAETAWQNAQVVVAGEFRLVDKGGKTCALLRFCPNNGPTLAIIDEGGNVRAAFGLEKDGTPFLGMLGKEKEPIWKAP